MSTAGELFTIVTDDYLDDSVTNDQGWSEAFAFRAINEAQKQSCNRSKLIYDDTTTAICEITLVNGQSSYSISELITDIEYVSFEGLEITQKTKDEMKHATPGWRTLTGMTDKTVNYVIRGKKIRFIPSPDATDAGKKVYLEVYRLPKTTITASGNTPEIPTEFHRDLIYWMLHEAYKKQDADAYNQEKSDYWLNEFEIVFGKFVSAQVRATILEQPRSMGLRTNAYTTNLNKTLSEEDWD
jgi:hypothetical protein